MGTGGENWSARGSSVAGADGAAGGAWPHLAGMSQPSPSHAPHAQAPRGTAAPGPSGGLASAPPRLPARAGLLCRL